MILEALVNILTAPMMWLFGLLPAFTEPFDWTGVQAGMQRAGYAAKGLETYVPVALILSVTGIAIAFRLVAAGIQAATWLYDRIPLKGT